jgi:hypothetical protein
VTTLRVVWPIVDPTVPAAQIAAEVREDLPGIAAACGARVTGQPTLRVADGSHVPGHPRVSRWVLIAEAPARAVALRPYRSATPGTLRQEQQA